jgi:hypothetical protein
LGTAATTGLLYQPRMIGDGDCGEICRIKLAGETEVLRENPPQRHFPAYSIVPQPTTLPRALSKGRKEIIMSKRAKATL